MFNNNNSNNERTMNIELRKCDTCVDHAKHVVKEREGGEVGIWCVLVVCFLSHRSSLHYLFLPLIDPLDQMCLEERVLFRLVSALHTSINTHVAFNYEKDKQTQQWSHNFQLFQKLVGNWPDRIKNLYFGYLFLLR